MITKTQFCQHIVDKFCCDNRLKPEHLCEDFITQSSSLAVAMEHLGLIKTPELQQYASERAGIFIAFSSKPLTEKGIDILTVREMIDLLPETLNERINNETSS